MGGLREFGIIPAGSVNTTRLAEYGSTLKAGIALDIWSLPKNNNGTGSMDCDNCPFRHDSDPEDLEDEDSCAWFKCCLFEQTKT